MSSPLSPESAPANSNDSPIHNNERCINYESRLNPHNVAISICENPLLPFGNYTIIDENGDVAYFDDDDGFYPDERIYLRYDDFEDREPIELTQGSELSDLVHQLINENENQLRLDAHQAYIRSIVGTDY